MADGDQKSDGVSNVNDHQVPEETAPDSVNNSVPDSPAAESTAAAAAAVDEAAAAATEAAAVAADGAEAATEAATEDGAADEDAADGVVAEQTPAAGGGGRVPVIVLSILVVILVAAAAVLGGLYVRERNAKMDADQKVASQREKIAEAVQRRGELQTQVKRLEDRVIDSAGYPAVKSCVEQGAELEKRLKGAIANPEEASGDQMGASALAFVVSDNCATALTHVK